jgi:hypothetical protein
MIHKAHRYWKLALLGVWFFLCVTSGGALLLLIGLGARIALDSGTRDLSTGVVLAIMLVALAPVLMAGAFVALDKKLWRSRTVPRRSTGVPP